MTAAAATLLCAATLLGSAEPTQIFVFNLRLEGGVSDAQGRLLTELMLSETQSTGRFDVVGESDVVTMLEAEQARQLIGCSDVSCLAEIGGALGAELMMVGTAGMVGTTYLVSLKIIETKKVKVLGRWSSSFEDTAQLVNAVREGAQKVLADTIRGMDAAAQPPSTQPGASLAPPPESVATTGQPEPPPTPEPPSTATTASPTPQTATPNPASDPASAQPAPYLQESPAAVDDESAFYETWWFWTIVGVGLAGAATAGIVVGSQGGGDDGTGPTGPTVVNFDATLPPPGYLP